MKQDYEELRQRDLHEHGGLNIIPDIMVILKNVNNDKEDNGRRKGQLETTAQTKREGKVTPILIHSKGLCIYNCIYTVIISHIKLIISINKYITYNHRDIIVILLNNYLLTYCWLN